MSGYKPTKEYLDELQQYYDETSAAREIKRRASKFAAGYIFDLDK